MAAETLDRIIEEVRALPLEDQYQLQRRIEDLIRQSDEQAREALVLEGLLRDGLITQMPDRRQDTADFDAWKPVEVVGKLLSETIVEERR